MYVTFFFQTNPIGVVFKIVLAPPSLIMGLNGCLLDPVRKMSNKFNSIQDYLYNACFVNAFHETIVVKQLYRKLSLYNRCIYCRNVIYLNYGKIWLILYILWGLASSEGFGIISSQVFGHLRSFKGWIQTEACVIPSYIPWQKQRCK